MRARRARRGRRRRRPGPGRRRQLAGAVDLRPAGGRPRPLAWCWAPRRPGAAAGSSPTGRCRHPGRHRGVGDVLDAATSRSRSPAPTPRSPPTARSRRSPGRHRGPGRVRRHRHAQRPRRSGSGWSSTRPSTTGSARRPADHRHARDHPHRGGRRDPAPRRAGWSRASPTTSATCLGPVGADGRRELRTQVRAGHLPAALPAAPICRRTTAAAAYESSWLACRLIADRVGRGAGAPLPLGRRHGCRRDQARRGGLAAVLHETSPQFTAQWRPTCAPQLA